MPLRRSPLSHGNLLLWMLRLCLSSGRKWSMVVATSPQYQQSPPVFAYARLRWPLVTVVPFFARVRSVAVFEDTFVACWTG